MSDTIIKGMWKIIAAQHQVMQTTATMVEWFFDVTPIEHRLEAAKKMDAYVATMKSCDELIAPVRKIMEEEETQ